MSLIRLFIMGGTLMYVLLFISIIVISIVIEKYRFLSRIRNLNARLYEALKPQDTLENIISVIKMYGEECPLGVMLEKLVHSKSSDIALTKESMESAANLELHKLEKGMAWLSTFAAVAPLIGFLGTVIGMVRVFMNIQTQSQSGVDINLLAGGIWEAMLTTIAGLIVGIIAIIFYNDLVQKLELIAKDLSDHAIEFIIQVQELKTGA